MTVLKSFGIKPITLKNSSVALTVFVNPVTMFVSFGKRGVIAETINSSSAEPKALL